MKAEYESLAKNGTWVLTTLPAHRKIIGCKWVFKVNEYLNGNVNKYKFRLVAKGSNMDLTSPRLFFISYQAYNNSCYFDRGSHFQVGNSASEYQ